MVWWGTRIQMFSGAYRLQRKGTLDERSMSDLLPVINRLREDADEIEPSQELRQKGVRLVGLYGLETGDSLQLAAALAWAGNDPSGREFVSLGRTAKSGGRHRGISRSACMR